MKGQFLLIRVVCVVFVIFTVFFGVVYHASASDVIIGGTALHEFSQPADAAHTGTYAIRIHNTATGTDGGFGYIGNLINYYEVPFMLTSTSNSTTIQGNNSGIGGGIYGSANSGIGVYGNSNSGNGGYFYSNAGTGLVAATNSGPYAAQFQGNIQVTGSVTGNGSGLTNLAGGNISAGTITASSIANGAITSGKIGFLSRVAIVSPVAGAGDYTNPATAMANYTSWCTNPPLSSSNPCLLKIMPGVYDIGTDSVVMQPYIDSEGSGENTTVIKGSINSITAGVVSGASNSELRFLTVQNTGGGGAGSNAVAFYNHNASPRLTHVTIISSGGLNNYGVYNYASGFLGSANPLMSNVTINVTGITNSANYGIFNKGDSGSSANGTIMNSTISVDGTFITGTTSHGVHNDIVGGGQPTVTGTKITASGMTAAYSVYTINAGQAIIDNSVLAPNVYNSSTLATLISGTKLTGISGTGIITCAGVRDNSYVFYASTCP